MDQERGSFSKMGFILAAAGSAVGLGNLWRFPFTVGENGGGVFVLMYLLSIIIIAIPVLLAEASLGRHTNKNPIGAFAMVKPGSSWPLVGLLGIICAFMILSFYAVIAGWTVAYFVKAVTGQFTNIGPEQAVASFGSFTSNSWLQLVLLAVFIVITVVVVSGGVAGGIEKCSKILMPVLLGILILLLIRSLTLKGAYEGVMFYLKPDFSKFSFKVVIAAIGQAFFSMSLGMGTMITYGSYVSKKDSLPSSCGWIAFFDTFIALMAGFIIFPAIFSQGMNPDQGSGVMFNVLPVLFSKMPGGSIFGSFFFLLLSIAALTSTISILEVPVSYLIDERKWKRKKASVLIGSIAFIIGICSALSNGGSSFFSNLPVFNIGFLDLWNMIWGNVALSVGALLEAIFVAYVWKTHKAVKEIKVGAQKFTLVKPWSFLIKYIVPVFIILILIGYFI